MSTKDTEKAENTATPTEKETNDNKVVFGPLGKYAVVGVIMVSIIVTTAIMLNKQLGTVEEQLAAMESEVAEINDANTVDIQATKANEATSETQDVAEVAKAQEVVKVEATEAQAVAAPATEVLAPAEAAAEKTVSEATSPATEAAAIAPAESNEVADDDEFQLAMDQREQEHQARIEAFKDEQKQHMSEMFTRIKTLEAQRLDEYKIRQDEQVERLRQKIAKQEQLIEELILRNNEWIEMRAASMQRSQSYREEMLERI